MSQFFGVSVLIRFNCSYTETEMDSFNMVSFSFKKGNEMEGNREEPLQLISVENYFQNTRMSNVQALCWNLIDFIILMFQFECRFLAILI